MHADPDAAATAPSPPRPLFRPEAIHKPEHGQPFAFSVPSWRLIAAAGAAIVGLIAVFATFAEFDRTELVRGVVVPTAGVARVSAPQAGVVTSVLVAQGARVTVGQPVVRLSSRRLLASGGAAEQVEVESFDRQRDLLEERTRAERERRVMEAQRLRGRLRQLEVDRRALAARMKLQEGRIASNVERLQSLATLREKGFVSGASWRTQEEQVLALRQELAELEQNAADVGYETTRAQLELRDLERGDRVAGLQARADDETLRRGRSGAEARLQTVIAAPAAGRVGAVLAHPGDTVRPSAVLLTILPPDERLEVVLFAPARAVGLLAPGQAVRVRYDAFPHQRFGSQGGVITSVSRTAAAPEQLDGPIRPSEPVYQVRVRLDRPRPGLRRFTLRPDMTLSAKVVLEKRSLLDWLFSPLLERQRDGRSAFG